MSTVTPARSALLGRDVDDEYIGIPRAVGPDYPCQLILLRVSPLLGAPMIMVRVLNFLFSLLAVTLRSRLSLQLEVAALRHQLSACQSKRQRPRIRPPDRLLWSFLARFWSGWRRALFFAQPRTVTLWQQKRFRCYWRALSQSGYPGRPKIAPELRALIRRMWQSNSTWGSPRIVCRTSQIGD